MQTAWHLPCTQLGIEEKENNGYGLLKFAYIDYTVIISCLEKSISGKPLKITMKLAGLFNFSTVL